MHIQWKKDAKQYFRTYVSLASRNSKRIKTTTPFQLLKYLPLIFMYDDT